MHIRAITAVTIALFAAGGAAAQSDRKSTQATPGVTSVKPDYTKSMEGLQAAAQRLRESIQAMAQKKPGPDRDKAISEAHEALYETQRAMIALPPELRSQGTVANVDYDRSVQQLMKAADSLRESIQAMAQQPAGERRNRAIDQASQALWDTQQAMVRAYDPARSKAMASDARGAASTGSGTLQSR